jgi:hypothetical protein
MSAVASNANAAARAQKTKRVNQIAPANYRQIQLKFWKELKDNTEQSSSLTCGDARPRHYMRIKTGVKNTRLSAVIILWDIETDKQDPELRAVVTLSGENGALIYTKLLEQRREIEAALGFPLIWRQTPGKQVFRFSRCERS